MITRFADTDDDGTGTTGTVHNNEWLTAIWDALDGRWSENTTTSTGNQDNFDYSEADVLRGNNASAVTFRGLKAPASPAKPGKPLMIYSVGAGTIVLNNQDTNSTAANRIITGTGAALTLAAGTGAAILVYDSVAARWRVLVSSVAATATPLQASVYNSTTQSIPDSTFTVATFDTEDYDVGGLHSTSSNTSRITVPTGGAGLWTFTGYLAFASNATGQRILRFFKNGSALLYGSVQALASASARSSAGGSVQLTLADGDYVEIAAFQDSGGALNIGDSAVTRSMLQGMRIR